MPQTLSDRAAIILKTAAPAEKVRLTFAVADAWAAGEIADVGTTAAPDRPARPAKPDLVPPGQMPKRSTGIKGRIALLHAIAHIEFNAIDLGWDIVLRFVGEDMPRAFYDDWVRVARDEALGQSERRRIEQPSIHVAHRQIVAGVTGTSSPYPVNPVTSPLAS